VTSGILGCTDSSNVVTVNVYPSSPTGSITNVDDINICSGNSIQLNINLTGNGNLTVFYKENNSDLQFNATAGSKTITRNPGAAGALDVYNYSLSKIVDGNGCLATSLSGSKKVSVYGIPVANAGPDQVVCGPRVTMDAKPSYGTGCWTYKFPSVQIIKSSANAASMSFTIDSALFVNGTMTRRFYWTETNWQCPAKDSVDIIFLKHPDHINAGKDSTLYSFDQVLHLYNEKPLSWENGTWSVVAGSGVIDTLTGRITGLSDGSNTFLWRIKNRLETCAISDILNITVKSIEVPKGISPNGDNINDMLVIRGLDLTNQDVEFTILNSAGAKVFSTYSSSGDQSTWQNWDGRNSQGTELPEGTYYYLLKMVTRNEGAAKSSDLLKGFIILKRQ
jgi:gliding motility-associated-like protein